jgi:hypothetical protein
VPNPTGPFRIELEIRSQDDRIEGRVLDGHGGFVAFSGWLELMAVVEGLIREQPGTR